MDYTLNLVGKRVVVLGGMGFVGHNLVKSLIDDYKCEVTIVDNLLNAKESTLNDYKGKFKFVNASVNDMDLSILDEFEYVFHLACVQIAHSSKDPSLDLNTNAVSTLRILEYYRYKKTKLEKFLYTSSASVYGNAQFGICAESGPTRTLSHYASTKYLGENYTLMYNKLYDLPTSSVRYSNVYGFGQSPANSYCGVLGKFMHLAITGEDLKIFGDGQQTRDYTFITDAVNATILASVHPNAVGEVFNVGTGIETSVNQLASWIKSKYPDTKISNIPPRDIDNIRRRYMDINFIQSRLQWEPLISIDEGLNSTLEWYKNYLETTE